MACLHLILCDQGVKKDNQHYEKIIDEEKAAIEKLEEKLKELSAREHKIVANIDK